MDNISMGASTAEKSYILNMPYTIPPPHSRRYAPPGRLTRSGVRRFLPQLGCMHEGKGSWFGVATPPLHPRRIIAYIVHIPSRSR